MKEDKEKKITTGNNLKKLTEKSNWKGFKKKKKTN